MRALLKLFVAVAALAATPCLGWAAECGTVTEASFTWKSAEVLANIDKLILERGYGCSVELQVGELVPLITTTIENGKPEIVPEGWVDLLPDLVKRGFDEGRLVNAGNPLPDGGMLGLWIPKYVADAHPDIKTIEDALQHPELFPAPEDPSKGAVVSSPEGSGASRIVRQLFKAYDGEKHGFVLINPGSSAALDGSIARAYERKKGWMGFYWAPTALLGKYQMVKLQHGVAFDAAEWKRCTTDPNCPDPKRNDWPGDHVETLVAKRFADRMSAEIKAFLAKRSWPNDTVDHLLAWMTDNQATGEDGAKYFLKTYPEIWTKWVPAEIADKIRAR